MVSTFRENVVQTPDLTLYSVHSARTLCIMMSPTYLWFRTLLHVAMAEDARLATAL